MRYISIALLMSLAFSSNAKDVSVTSPDGHIKVTVSDNNQTPKYQVSYKGQSVINPSRLGMAFKQHAAFGQGFEIKTDQVSNHKSSWQQPWGERKTVVDHHKQMTVQFNDDKGRTFSVKVRVFNDGLGFRYEVPEQKGLKGLEITNELTEFVIRDSGKSDAWWIPARGWNRYEYPYRSTRLHEVDRAHTPFTFKNGSGVHMSIHEAALVDYSAMSLDQRRDGTLVADLAPWSDGIKVKTQAGFKTPWRTIQISPDAVGLLNSDIILNLNEPNKLGDVSWVKPGKYVGIWWGMHINKYTWGSGEKHGATTENTKKYLDFAAKYGFDGVLVEGWNIGWDGDWFFNGDVFDFTKAYKDFDMAELARYGKSKGVQLIGHHETSGNVTNYRNQMMEALDLYEAHNVSQIKTGYVADGGNIKRIDEQGIVRHEWHDGQFMVGEYLHNVKEAAKRKISINTHEPVKDTGLRRTYPNWLAREGARGQEFNAWGNPPNPPEHAVLLSYTRMLSGPMDFTPGIFDMDYDKNKVNRPQTTLAKQLALYVVLYSPIQMAADLPENYEAKMDAFQFIRDVPTDWEQSKAIAGEVGEYVAFARQERDGKDWYLGAISDEKARKFDVSLDFLTPGKSYEAQIYRDGDKADWQSNPYDIVIEKKRVTSKDKLAIRLATSGGLAVRFKAL